MTDRDGTINFWNDYAETITGWNKEEVIGRPAKALLDVRSPSRETDNVPGWPPLEGTQPLRESRILQKDGGLRWVEWSGTPIYDLAGRVAGYAGLGEDVTELRTLRAEAARLASDEQFCKVADTAPLMIWTAGIDMKCTFVNQAWIAFSGRGLEQELSHDWTTNVHPDDSAYSRATYAAAWEQRRNVQLEYRKRRADGEYRWILDTGVPRFTPDGEFLGYIGTTTDITDLKRNRDENTARQKLETVGRLAGGIAHDFNNLLGGVLAQAELGLTEVSSGVLPGDELNNIRDVAIRGAGIVRQLMIYAGQESADSEPVDLSSLIDDMRGLLKVVVSKHIVLKTELSRELPAVLANSARISQLLLNLVTNASEAIDGKQGVIRIRTWRADGQSLLEKRWLNDGYVQLEISDNGCGMSPETQARVFEPFFSTRSEGRGLGLAVVEGIVRSLGGTIELESKLGGGTKVRISMPSAGESSAPVGERRAEPAQRPGAMTILLVEDEDALRQAVSKMLRKMGMTIIEAANGSAAIDAIRAEQRIDALILDITIPGASSRDVFAEAKRLWPETRMIVLSAYPKDVAAASLQAPIEHFIRKPYRVSELVELLRQTN
jgi:PAS domain S-box-containing protein